MNQPIGWRERPGWFLIRNRQIAQHRQLPSIVSDNGCLRVGTFSNLQRHVRSRRINFDGACDDKLIANLFQTSHLANQRSTDRVLEHDFVTMQVQTLIVSSPARERSPWQFARIVEVARDTPSRPNGVPENLIADCRGMRVVRTVINDAPPVQLSTGPRCRIPHQIFIE